MHRLLLIAFGLFGAGCVSTGQSDSRPDGSPQDAAEINYQLGSQYLRQGKLKLARERLERAIEQDPKLPGPYTALALLYDRTGDTARAASYYRQALRVAPDDANVQNVFAFFLCDRGEFEEGQVYFLRAARNPTNRSPEVAFGNAGVCALQKPDQIAAEQHFRSALKRNPAYAASLEEMAKLSFESGNALQARAFLERYEAAGHAMTPELLLLGVRVEKTLGNRAALKDYAAKLRRRFPDSVEAQRLTETLNGR